MYGLRKAYYQEFSHKKIWQFQPSRGYPLLSEEELETKRQQYLRALHGSGGAISTADVMKVARGIVLNVKCTT